MAASKLADLGPRSNKRLQLQATTYAKAAEVIASNADCCCPPVVDDRDVGSRSKRLRLIQGFVIGVYIFLSVVTMADAHCSPLARWIGVLHSPVESAGPSLSIVLKRR